MSKVADVRTWIELERKMLLYNFTRFLNLLPLRVRLMAVVKSNAYGHGLTLVAKTLVKAKVKGSGKRLFFGVDSVVEALRLRREGIGNQILVLGSTLPTRLKEAAAENITLTVSSFEALKEVASVAKKPFFHLKIDTGMHRQGFLESDVVRLIGELKRHKLSPEGIFTHFASAKDIAYPSYTEKQFALFSKVDARLSSAGFGNLIRHAAATGATLLFPKTHLDMVRIGIGLYGYYPSLETELYCKKYVGPTSIDLQPIFGWKTVVSEVKNIPRGSFVGYDLTERVSRDTKIAVLPVGYWHGFDRGLSSTGEVLLRGRRRRVLGRVSMDMTVVDVTDKPAVKTGDEAVLIGTQGREIIFAEEIARKTGTSPYEVLTRINPLIQRTLV